MATRFNETDDIDQFLQSALEKLNIQVYEDYEAMDGEFSDSEDSDYLDMDMAEIMETKWF